MKELKLAHDNFDNYAWSQLIRSIVNYTALPGENIDDIVVGCWEIGQIRAELLGRDLEIWQDIPYALSIFCWWPFKPSLYSEKDREWLLNHRKLIFDGCAKSPSSMRDIVFKILPKENLCMETNYLFSQIKSKPISEIINLDYISEKIILTGLTQEPFQGMDSEVAG